MAWELGRRDDAADLERRYQRAGRTRVAAAQEPDGYLHTSFGRPGQPPRYSDLESGHELYCFGHLFQAAVARLRTGHDDLLPQVARRAGRSRLRPVRPARDRVGVCGHPEIEMALAELARATGEDRYLEHARLFVERRGTGTLAQTSIRPGVLPGRRAGPRGDRAARPRGARAVPRRGRARRRHGDRRRRLLAAAVRRQWANTVARRTYLTGGVGSHHQDEAFGDDFELPPDRAYAETCAGIASVMLSWRLLLATGEEKYADLIERTLLTTSSPRRPAPTGAPSSTRTRCTSASPGTVPDDGRGQPARRVRAARSLVRGLLLPDERRAHAGQRRPVLRHCQRQRHPVAPVRRLPGIGSAGRREAYSAGVAAPIPLAARSRSRSSRRPRRRSPCGCGCLAGREARPC